MAYLNTATNAGPDEPEKEYHIETPQHQYDLNFCFPVKVLESDGVRLEPMVPSKHAKDLFELIRQDPNVYRFLSVFPQSVAELCTIYEMEFRRNTSYTVFVIYDKTFDPPRIAGTINYGNSTATHLIVELSHITILTPYQRSHVNTHACGLLIKYALEPRPVGLAVRRVFWFCHASNEPSRRAAERLGFKFEGIHRWHRVLAAGKEGLDASNDLGLARPENGIGRHTCTLSITWEDWRDHAKEHIESLMAKPLPKRQ